MSEPGRLRFECTECGDCCKRRGTYAYVYLNDVEVEALAEFLRLDEDSFRKRYAFVDSLGWTQIRFDGEACPFLDPDTNRCGVYPARPVQCSTFPFWRKFVVDGDWTAEVAELCEGIGQGSVTDAEVVEANMQAKESWSDPQLKTDS